MTKFYKLLFFTTLMMSTLIAISSYSWMGMWIGLEINVLSIIPILINQKNKISSESGIKYFLTQTIASTSIMISIISMMSHFSFSETLIKDLPILIMNSGFLLKMGMAPFHFWFPEVLEGLSWLNSMIMLTWQKITPMVMLMYNIESSLFYMVIIIISMIISGMMAINQISLRKILAYSSINHMGWMMSSMMLSQSIWLIYFSIYVITTVNIIMMFNLTNSFFVPQLNLIWNFNPMIKLFFLLNFLSMAGIPPFIGFLPKWLTIQVMINNNMYFMTMIMMMMTLIMIYVYLMMMMSSATFSVVLQNWLNLTNSASLKKLISLMNFFMITALISVTLMMGY
uniref:NADH-ubiquinone oxidoreductase chain 2 n=1 Tax=Pyrocoelia thibetana TaxID=370602 RepID=A0A5C0PX43_9COLE|nr:NADH dehydrogenase subunit 2 [Pyrocoelia thibetana]QEJ81643.1 NADH dehydrogenase subunit 2 [Pyrocoelia thibetana]